MFTLWCAHDARFSSSLTILGPKLSIARTRSTMSDAQKNSQNKSCKRTGSMQAALCNKLLTIYATAKTGWEVNPPCLSLSLSVSLSVYVSLSVSVSWGFHSCVFSSLFQHSFSTVRARAIPPVPQTQSGRSLQSRPNVRHVRKTDVNYI